MAVILFSVSCVETEGGMTEPKLYLDRDSVLLYEGDSILLRYAFVPDAALPVVWNTEDSAVAAVDAHGLVVALSEGRTQVSVSSENQSDECTVVVRRKVDIGDFYYADGTSSGELDADKTVLGVVFWAGDPAVDDPALRREHPDCVNGLVIGAFADEPNYWQSTVYDCGISVGEWIGANAPFLMPPLTGTLEEDGLNRMVGFSNTQALMAFDADESNSGWPLEILDNFREYQENSPVPPENSSGWYIPSVKELSLLCSGEYDGNIWNMQMPDVSNLDRVNASLSKISRHSPIIGTSYYWSSSEYSALEALGLDMLSGKVAYTVKDTYPWRIRCVLAF